MKTESETKSSQLVESLEHFRTFQIITSYPILKTVQHD